MPDAVPPLPPTTQAAPTPDRAASTPGVSGRSVVTGLLLLVGACFAVAVLVLVNSEPRVSIEEYPVEPDGTTASRSPVTSEIRCVPPTGGTDDYATYESGEDLVFESADVSDSSYDRGLLPGETAALCGRARASRTAYAVEAGLVSLLLLGAGGLLVVRRRPTAT